MSSNVTVPYSNSSLKAAIEVLYSLGRTYECQELIYEALMNEWVEICEIEHILYSYVNGPFSAVTKENATALLDYESI